MNKFEFPKQLQSARQGAGYGTARSFSKILAINENRYSRYERGKSEPNLELLCRICRLLGTTPNQLLGFADAPVSIAQGADADAAFRSRRGFGEPGSQNYSPVGKTTTALVDGLLWDFCRKFVSAGAMSEAKTKRGKSRSDPVTIAMIAPLYKRLRHDPVNELAGLVTEREYGDLPLPRRLELEPLMQEVMDAVVTLPRAHSR